MTKIDAKLISRLACPHCVDAAKLTDNGDSLRCEGCGRVYPVKDGVPDMLPESGVAVVVVGTSGRPRRDEINCTTD